MRAPLDTEKLQKVVRDAVKAEFFDAEDETTIFVSLRGSGRKLATAWATQAGLGQALASAIEAAHNDLKAETEPDTLELCVFGEKEDVDWEDRGKSFNNLRKGMNGLEITFGQKTLRVAPTEMIASNRKFDKMFEDLLGSRRSKDPKASKKIKLARVQTRQFLVPLLENKDAIEMFRGNQVVNHADVTRENVENLAKRMSAWMFNNLMSDGRMLYKYWPSQGKESNANNTIRQWMATTCLIRIARHYGDDDMMDRVSTNIIYNMTHFFKLRSGLGSIEFDGSSKLGAIALAALAVSEHRDSATFWTYERDLRKSIDHLWQSDGAFRTFLLPQDRNDNQNFYPGEALLYLAHQYHNTNDEALGFKLLQSVKFYKDWHLENRNPAFIPWHTMAYAKILDRRNDASLLHWVFEMNDWLLSMQQTAPARFPDIDGRFYDPERAHFGPPHASATGVYLEGLIAAFKLARKAGDTKRTEAYRKAIVRGVRSLMQLEFRDEIDMFYVSKRERVFGGVRTTVYNNEIRVDNVQHGLMAILQILKEFSQEDFAL